jgi:hypothetical protein
MDHLRFYQEEEEEAEEGIVTSKCQAGLCGGSIRCTYTSGDSTDLCIALPPWPYPSLYQVTAWLMAGQ